MPRFSRKEIIHHLEISQRTQEADLHLPSIVDIPVQVMADMLPPLTGVPAPAPSPYTTCKLGKAVGLMEVMTPIGITEKKTRLNSRPRVELDPEPHLLGNLRLMASSISLSFQSSKTGTSFLPMTVEISKCVHACVPLKPEVHTSR